MRILQVARSRGFSLIELAVALFVIALVLGSILVPLTTQVNQRQISDTQKALEEIREALIGFAMANGHLPCPAKTAIDGLEDRVVTVCGVGGGHRLGYIPWATLGVSKLDAWGHIFRYSVTPGYSRSDATAPPRFILGQAGDITITSLATSIPAVVLSHGKNGYGSVDDQDIPQALPAGWPASNTDENTNATGLGTTFVSRVPQAAGAPGPGGEFDDIVVWLSPNILFNRMVAAGKLP